jgi:hypothetical protein
MTDPLRIAILGAGPAGISLASQLAPLRHLQVEIFDGADAVGGQSFTRMIDGVSVELGTCYLTDGYRIVKDLASEVGCPAEILPKATLLNDDGQAIAHGSPDAGLIAEFLALWARWYAEGQMQRPTDPDNALRFDAWLDKHGLGALAQQFTFAAGLTAQLYGPISEVSAHSALTWMRPSLFVAGEFSRTAAIPRGFQTMWTEVAARTGATIHHSTRVEALQRAGGGWLLAVPGRGPVGPFDHVFIACPLDSVESPISRDLREKFGPFESSQVYSAIWRARGWPEAAPSRCYLPACASNERGRLLTIRRNGGAADTSVGQLCAYAIDGLSVEAHRERIRADAERIVGLRDMEFRFDRIWRYNIRYSPAQLRDGLPLFLDDAQGREGVWYSGGALSHWNVDAITDFNHVLAQRFACHIGAPILEQLELERIDEVVRDL